MRPLTKCFLTFLPLDVKSLFLFFQNLIAPLTHTLLSMSVLIKGSSRNILCTLIEAQTIGPRLKAGFASGLALFALIRLVSWSGKWADGWGLKRKEAEVDKHCSPLNNPSFFILKSKLGQGGRSIQCHTLSLLQSVMVFDFLCTSRLPHITDAPSFINVLSHQVGFELAWVLWL